MVVVNEAINAASVFLREVDKLQLTWAEILLASSCVTRYQDSTLLRLNEFQTHCTVEKVSTVRTVSLE